MADKFKICKEAAFQIFAKRYGDNSYTNEFPGNFETLYAFAPTIASDPVAAAEALHEMAEGSAWDVIMQAILAEMKLQTMAKYAEDRERQKPEAPS